MHAKAEPLGIARAPTSGSRQHRHASAGPGLPCRREDPELFFALEPALLEQAKRTCEPCPIKRQCLAAALQHAEPWGVWGGEIIEAGRVVAYKRPSGRPRKTAAA